MDIEKLVELLPGIRNILESLENNQEKIINNVNNQEIQQLVQILPRLINTIGQLDVQKQFFPLLPGLNSILDKIEAQQLLKFLPGFTNLLNRMKDEDQILQLLPGINHILNSIETQGLLELLPNINNILNNMDIQYFFHLIPGFNNILQNRKDSQQQMELLPEERDKLEKFRDRVHNIYPLPDFKLIAWLRARDLDLDRAEQMLRRHILWKKNNQLTQVLKFECEKTYFPFIISGYDLDGVPVIIAPTGRFDIRGIVETGDVLSPIQFAMKTGEMLETAGTLLGISQVNVIVDFEAFSYSQITHRTVIQGMIEGMRIFEANFPEILKNAFVINAPKVFHILFALIKPIMHSRTLSKVQIFDDNKEKWKHTLFKNIARDQIPPHWGGSKAGRDKYCSEAWFQPPLAANYMRKVGQSRDEYGEEWINVKVEAGEELEFEYYLEAKKGTLKWAFRTDGYNIGFSVMNVTGDFEDDPEVVLPYRLVESHKNTEEGSVKLDKQGKYVLIFHNHFSKSRAKSVHYQISLT